MKSHFVMFTFLLLPAFGFTQPIDGEEKEVLSFVLIANKPIVQGMLNGKKAYFLIDTGSDLTILNTQAEKTHHFKTFIKSRGQPQVIGFGGGLIELPHVYNVEVFLGKQKIITSFVAHDLSRVTGNVGKSGGIKITGIIGSDVLIRYDFMIDFGGKKVYIPKNMKKEKTSPKFSKKFKE